MQQLPWNVFVAAYRTLRTIVIVKLLGIQKLSNAIGLCALFQGIAVMIGSPMSGTSVHSILFLNSVMYLMLFIRLDFFQKCQVIDVVYVVVEPRICWTVSGTWICSFQVLTLSVTLNYSLLCRNAMSRNKGKEKEAKAGEISVSRLEWQHITKMGASLLDRYV